MTTVSISLCPTELEFNNGDRYNHQKLIEAIKNYIETKFNDVYIITLQVGYKQGQKWAYINNDKEQGSQLLSEFFGTYGTDDELFEN